MDDKEKKLAKTIINYSIAVKAKEKVLISCSSMDPLRLIKYLIEEIKKKKAIPYVKLTNLEIDTKILEKASSDIIDNLVETESYEVNNYDSFIRIRYIENNYEDKNVGFDIKKEYNKKMVPVVDVRVNDRKWVLLNYPSVLDAYKAKKSKDEFMKYALDVMNVDYAKMEKDIEPLKKLMEKTDQVHIIGPQTDITFSIKDMNAIPCTGKSNIPDGELYTAPHKKSVNGVITYNTPSPYQGEIYEGVSLKFKDGKIIEASCKGNNKKLNEIFDTDKGARYIGEFSLGFNPLVLDPMGDILYDEKIIGSLHFTPGRCYKDADNGNESGIHWDLVLIQRLEYGGGEIYFDGVLIRKNGFFVLPELKHLNYGLDD